jgi:hypothetical protein
VFPVGGFFLAVVVHALHGVLAYSLLALSVITVISTVVGVALVAVIAVWSLLRQQRCLQAELKGLVPDDVYRVMVTTGARARAQWQALWRGGIRQWWRMRRLYQLCAELAFKRMQARLCPDEVKIAEEARQLQERVEAML